MKAMLPMKIKHQRSFKEDRCREEELILACIRAFVHNNPEAVGEAINDSHSKEVDREVDWTYLIEAAKRKRVLPLVYWAINSQGAKFVPETVKAALKREFDQNSLHNLKMTGELFRLLDIFRSNSIPAIAFKGPILAASIYGNIAFRQFWDLDILVHPEDFIRAKGLVRSLGYAPWQPLSDGQYEELIRSDEAAHDCRFSKAGAIKTHLELHWKVYPEIYSSRLETRQLFERAESSILFGHEILSFSPEDMLIYFCHHGTKHQWAMLSWLCDLAMLLEHKEIDWDYVRDFAGKAGIGTALNMGLILAYDALKAPIPEAVLHEAMRCKAARSQAIKIECEIFSKSKGWAIESWIYQFKSMSNEEDRFKYFLYIAKMILRPNQEDKKFIKLPDALGFAYIFVRPIRIIHTHLLKPS